MHLSWLIWIAIAVLVIYLALGRQGPGMISRGIRTMSATKGAMDAFRIGDYATALLKAEALNQGSTRTPEYCFVRGSMLHQLGNFREAEAILREGLPLEKDLHSKALVCDVLGSVLMDDERFDDAVASFEDSIRAWPNRGAGARGMAEVLLRQGRELPDALSWARGALEIDRSVSGLTREIRNLRLAMGKAILAWALAANSAEISEIEPLVAEAISLCGDRTKPYLAQVHYHAGRAYLALKIPEKSAYHFRQATEIDPQGIFGRLARAMAC